MDEIKGAFHKVKSDFNKLEEEVVCLKEDLEKIKEILMELVKKIPFEELNKKKEILEKGALSTEKEFFETEIILNKTTKNDFRPLKDQNWGISNGNEGVQTDRQTDRQIDKQTQKRGFFTQFDNAANAIESINDFKKNLGLLLNLLTPNEILIFSAIYQFEEEKGFCNYKDLSRKFSLTESSIRDYVRRLILKEIPLEKEKINNKEVHLRVSPSLKKLISLKTFLSLTGKF